MVHRCPRDNRSALGFLRLVLGSQAVSPSHSIGQSKTWGQPTFRKWESNFSASPAGLHGQYCKGCGGLWRTDILSVCHTPYLHRERTLLATIFFQHRFLCLISSLHMVWFEGKFSRESVLSFFLTHTSSRRDGFLTLKPNLGLLYVIFHICCNVI